MKNYFEWHPDKCDFERGDFIKPTSYFHFKRFNICRQKTYAMNISLQFKLDGKDHQNVNNMEVRLR